MVQTLLWFWALRTLLATGSSSTSAHKIKRSCSFCRIYKEGGCRGMQSATLGPTSRFVTWNNVLREKLASFSPTALQNNFMNVRFLSTNGLCCDLTISLYVSLFLFVTLTFFFLIKMPYLSLLLNCHFFLSEHFYCKTYFLMVNMYIFVFLPPQLHSS